MTLYLRNAGTCLVLDLLTDRLPVVRHWGADLGALDESALADTQCAQYLELGENLSWGAPDLPIVPMAYHGWSARPSLLVHRNDGTAFSPHPDQVTHSVDNEQTAAGIAHIVTSKAVDSTHKLTFGTRIRLEPSGLIRVRAWVQDDRTDSDALAPLVVDEVTPLLPLPQVADEILDMTGHHLAERSLQRTELTVGTHLRESWEGKPGLDAATWLIAGRRGFGFRAGTVYGTHLAWSGNTRSLIAATAPGRKLIGCGELLLPGEILLDNPRIYTSPWAVFSWGEGLDALSHRTHAYLRALSSHPRTPRPVVLNTYEATYFHHDLEKLKELANKAAQVGVERFVLDDGWFGARRDDKAGLGDWQVSTDVYPQGLAPLAQHVRSLGMEFGLWFEPEMINLDSDLARAHPDWVLSDGAGGAPENRFQRVLDLCAPGAWEYLYEAISKLVEELDIAFIKWDHNSPLLAAGHQVAHPTAGRYGAAAVHDQTLALYRLLDALHARFPQLEIESCASGGGRIDLEIMQRAQRVWASDSIDSHERQNIQRGTTLLLPPEYIGTHVGTNRAHATRRELDLTMRAGTALWGHMGVEWDLTRVDEATLRQLADLIALHKQLRPLLHSGLTVHADLADDNNLRIEGVVATDGSDALYEIVCLGTQNTWPTSPYPLPGLDPDRIYRVRLATPPYAQLCWKPAWMRPQGVCLPGSYLRTTGLAIPVLHPDHLVLVRVTATN